MNRFLKAIGVLSISLATAFTVGCDWSSGGNSSGFNTSQSAGIVVNWSGVYNGNLSGGDAVGAVTSVGRVTRLVVSQGGNAIDVIDNNGLRYQGSIGSPGAVATPVNGVLPANSEFAASQITFSGNGVDFVGILHAVAVEEIIGSTEDLNTTDASSNVDRSVDDTTTVLNETDTQGDITIQTITTTVTQGGVQIVTVETITTDNSSGVEISREISTTSTDLSVDTREDNTRSITTFVIQEQNSQIRLEGTWIDSAGAFGVDALSRGASGSITTESITTPTIEAEQVTAPTTSTEQ